MREVCSKYRVTQVSERSYPANFIEKIDEFINLPTGLANPLHIKLCRLIFATQCVELLDIMARNSGHLSPHSICGLTTKIKIAENTSRLRPRNVLDYSELNALSSVILYNTSKRKKT